MATIPQRATLPIAETIRDSDSAQEVITKLAADAEAGLTQDEAAHRLEKYGPNAIEEKRTSPLERFVAFFWGPIPWMIEVAAILSGVVRRWDDFVIIVAMLLINAGVGFWEEFKADNAIEALKQNLALRARVLRDGQWREVEAKTLVPGDIVLIRLGNIVPADLRLIEGEYISVDQSALTGESLPVDRKVGGLACLGLVARVRDPNLLFF